MTNILLKKIPSWLGIIIILIVWIVAVFLVLDAKEAKQNQSRVQEIKEVFSYIGEITQIKDKEIVFKAEPNNNSGLEKEISVIASISEQTKLVKTEAPKTLPQDLEPGQSVSLFTSQEITLSDLKIGDKIIVSSKSNIKDKNKFEAIKIEALSP